MKQGPEFRIVGGASAEQKEAAQQELQAALFSHFESLSPEEQEQMRKFEYPKSEKEAALIDFVNEETAKLMQAFGVEPYEIPHENYHILPPDLFEKFHEKGSDAVTVYKRQGMLYNARRFRTNPVYFGAVAFHETAHLKGHTAFILEEEGEKADKIPYRMGVGVQRRHGGYGSHHGYAEHFEGLHEAIIAVEEKRFLPRLLELPVLQEEKEWLVSPEAEELKKKVAAEKGISEDEIIWTDKKGDVQLVSYRAHRHVLDYVCGEIQHEFSDQYQSKDAVFDEFLRAHFTGRLLPIARLVERTFGEGSFRLLGDMTDDEQSAVLHMESLRRARARELRSNTSS